MGKHVTTYLLGAGFSKSAHAPLPLSCDFFERLRDRSLGEKPFLQANPSLQTLDALVREYFPHSPDLEEVMSFLAQQFFPPAFRQHWQHRTDAYAELLDQVASVYGGPLPIVADRSAALGRFADRVVADGSNVLTFNYDCILDHFMERTTRWHCASGYGALLRHASHCFHEVPTTDVPPSPMSILKLHGSVNWGVPDMDMFDGEQSEVFYIPPNLALAGCNIAHAGVRVPASAATSAAVGFRPFIVPPITDKSQSYRSRILRRLWYLAREVLSVSDRIVIVGYSFPPTDYMARFLFREALGTHLARHMRHEILVANTDCSVAYRDRVKSLLVNSDVSFAEQDALAFLDDLSREPLNAVQRPSVSTCLQLFTPAMPFAQTKGSGGTT